MKPDYKLVAKAKYIHANADLASEIWHEVYKRYYPAKQLDTLVETLQSADAIEADIDNDVNYFLVVLGGKTIGYFAWKMENTALHLLHLYLKPEYRGKALGRDILATCERLARGEGRAGPRRGRSCGHSHAADHVGKNAVNFPLIFCRVCTTIK